MLSNDAITVTVSVALLPEVSVATTVMVFAPSDRVMPLLQLVVPVARMPFTMTFATAVSSDAVPETVIVRFVTVESLVGDVMVIVGGVASNVVSQQFNFGTC